MYLSLNSKQLRGVDRIARTQISWCCRLLGLLLVCVWHLGAHSQDSGGAIDEQIITETHHWGTQILQHGRDLRLADRTFKTPLDLTGKIQKHSSFISSYLRNESVTDSFLAGNSALNHNGLGPQRTLVLLNGKRLAPLATPIEDQSYQSFVNAHMFSPGYIKGYRTMTNSLSSIYGPDAVAGLVNFESRDNFEGIEVGIEFDTIPDTDLDSDLHFTWGIPFGDRKHLLLSAGLRSESHIPASARSWSQHPLDTDNPAGWSNFGNPGSVKTANQLDFVDPGCSNFGGQLRAGDCWYRDSAYSALVEENLARRYYFEYNSDAPNGGQFEFIVMRSEISLPNTFSAPSQAPVLNALNPLSLATIPNDQPHFVDLVQRINNGDFRDVGESSICNRMLGSRPVWITAAALGETACDDYTPSATDMGYGLNDDEDSVLFYSATNTLGTGAMVGIQSRALGTTTAAIDLTEEGVSDHTHNFYSFDYSFSIGRRTDLRAVIAVSNNRVENFSRGLMVERLNWALQGYGGPSCSPNVNPTMLNGLNPGQTTCSYFNPFSTAITRVDRALLNNAQPAYLNEDNSNFNEANSEDLLNWLFEDQITSFNNTLNTAAVEMTGNWFTLPGGLAGVGLGFEIRDLRRESNYFGFTNTANFPCRDEFMTTAGSCSGEEQLGPFASGLTGTNLRQSDEVMATHTELFLPLLSRYHLSFGVRQEESELFNEQESMDIRHGLAIGNGLTIYQHFGTFFNYPQLSQLDVDKGSLQYIPAIGDIPAVGYKRIQMTSHEDLTAETGESTDFGIQWSSKNFNLHLSYWMNEIENPIYAETLPSLLSALCPENSCPRDPDPDADPDLSSQLIVPEAVLALPGNAEAVPLADVTSVQLWLRNGSLLESSGLDLSLSATFGKARNVRLRANLSNLMSYNLNGVDLLGKGNNTLTVGALPQSKLAIAVDFSVGLFDVGIDYNQVDGYTQTDLPSVGAYSTLDFTLSYHFLKKSKGYIKISNLLDEDPPVNGGIFNYDSRNADPYGLHFVVGTKLVF